MMYASDSLLSKSLFIKSDYFTSKSNKMQSPVCLRGMKVVLDPLQNIV